MNEGILKKWLTPGIGQGKSKMSSGQLIGLGTRKCSKNDVDETKNIATPLKRLPVTG